MALSSGTRTACSRLLAVLGAAALVLVAMALSPVRPASAASNVEVSVGYADTLRANPNNFPTPWSGTPGVHFSGCQPFTSCSFDAGAARVVNHSPVPLTVDSVIIKLSTCTFDMWTHNVVLQPEEQFIVTQTASGAADGCDNAAGFFDTSDIGPNGASWAGNCTQSGVIPEVDVSINGSVSVFHDTGQVLNTGGVDAAVCPPVSGNESEQWTPVGSVPCPGSTLTLAPPSQTQTAGSPATVTATFQNTCGNGLPGALVDFAISSGPNAGTTGSATTDANGNASFTYASGVVGTDTVGSSVTNPAGTIPSNDVTVTWVKKASSLALTGAGTSDFDDPAAVAAVLGDSSGPLAGRTITFTLDGAETCSATTDATGAGSCSLTPGEAAGTYPLVVTFAGDATHDPSSATGSFVVTLEETTLTYTGPTRAANGQPITLSGVLQEDGVTPIAGRTVTFTLGAGGSAQSCSGTTDGSGSASCTIASVNQPAGTTSVPVTAAFAGDAFYQPASASATLRFTFMTGRAFGISSTGLVGISPTPDTGPVATAVASTAAPPCVATISGLISAHTLCAKVVTAVNPGSSTATASVQDATIGVIGVPVIKIGAVQASSQTTCAGSSGDTTITSLSVGGMVINVNLHPGPNTTINVLGVKIVLNEQVPVAGADKGLTVNGVHVSVAGLLDVVVASATSDIHNC